MFCKNCGKEIDNNSKFCDYCGNIIKEKKKRNPKTIMWILFSILIIVSLVVILLLINSNKKNITEEKNTLYSLSELEFLNQINTNEIFTTLGTDVNSELFGTYAFLITTNFNGTQNIIALKEDNSMVNIATTIYNEYWGNSLDFLYYSDGKIYYDDADSYWSISLTEGNGNYTPKNYEFLNNYVLNWFYVKNDFIYSLSDDALVYWNLNTQEKNTIDYSYFIMTEDIDYFRFGEDYDDIYVDSENMNIFVDMEKDGILKIDVNNEEYELVDTIDQTADLLSYKEKLIYKDIIFNYEYNNSPDFFIEYQNKRYDLEHNNYRPITLLPNNYLMVEHYIDEDSFIGKTEYISLKTGLKDENYSLDYNSLYGSKLYFITK